MPSNSEDLRKRIDEVDKYLYNAKGDTVPQLLFEILHNQKVIMETLMEIKLKEK